MKPADGIPALRLAIMCDGATAAAWHARCIEALIGLSGVEPVVVIMDTRPARHPRRRGVSPWWPRWSDRVTRRSQALRSVDLSGLLTGIPHVAVHSDSSRARSEDVDEALLATLARLELDVVLQLSPAPVPASLPGVARLGVWSMHARGDRHGNSVLAPGFWEIRRGAAVTAVELRSRTEANAPTVVGQAFFRTRSHTYVRTLDDALFGAAVLPARACRAILAGAEPFAMTDVTDDRVSSTTTPTNRDLFAFAARLFANFVTSQVMAIACSPQWNVGVVDAPVHRFLDPSFRPRVRWIPKAPRDRFVADPFGLPDGSAREWLVESYDYTTNRGVIAAFDPSGTGAPGRPVLPVEGHASYPYLLRHRGEVYCVPQLDDAGGIRIFRAVRYPMEWEDAGVLVAGVVARDATPFEHEGRWWLAFTDAAAPVTDLHVWWADDLLSDWHPHAANPVKIDVRSARPAGTPFFHDGVLYRPAQDCSRSYGGGVAICRVDTLTPTEFHEDVVRIIRSMPNGYRRGTHTLASIGDATLVDGKRLVFTFAGTRRALRSRLSHLPRNREPARRGSRG
jgi:hypothetical protein